MRETRQSGACAVVIGRVSAVSAIDITVKVSFLYSAVSAQSAFTLYFPDRPVQSNTISTSLGSIQPYATINVRTLLVHISTTVYSQLLIYIHPLTIGHWVSTIYYLSSAICHLPSAICHLLSVICYLSYVVCHLSPVVCRRFVPSEWGPCSATCGPGVRRRQVQCKVFSQKYGAVINQPSAVCTGEWGQRGTAGDSGPGQ